MASRLGPKEVKRQRIAGDKQARAVELVEQGWSYRRIAAELDYAGPSGVKKAIDSALKKAPSRAVESLREEVDGRARLMLEQLMPIVLNKKTSRDARLEAMDRVIKIDKELRALHGLDAPTSIRFDMSKMNDEQLRQILGDGAGAASRASTERTSPPEGGGDEAPLEGGEGARTRT